MLPRLVNRAFGGLRGCQNAPDSSITSVTWRSKAFDTTMLGHRLVFYPPEGLELMKDQIEFVTAKLS